MVDEFENYKKEDGSIDWGKYYTDKANRDLDADSQKKIVELEDLRIFTLADELSDYIWDVVQPWEYFAKKTVGDQYVRAADSVGANIAEGYGRYFFGEYTVFLYYSRGSLQETRYWTEKARKRKLLKDEEYGYVKERLDTLPKELNAMIKNIKMQAKKWKGRGAGTGYW